MTADNLTSTLHDAFPVDAHELAALRARLADEAEHRDLVQVAYRNVDSPVGALLLAATHRGLVRVAFAGEGREAVLQSLADRIGPRVLESPRRLDDAARELDEYFAGVRRRFDVALDWQLSSGFRRTVLTHLPTIEYGTWRSYRDLAEQAGSPRAVRAVGTACATNPLPVVVPCHRVLRADGALGNYLGGADAKRALLTLEGAL